MGEQLDLGGPDKRDQGLVLIVFILFYLEHKLFFLHFAALLNFHKNLAGGRVRLFQGIGLFHDLPPGHAKSGLVEQKHQKTQRNRTFFH